MVTDEPWCKGHAMFLVVHSFSQGAAHHSINPEASLLQGSDGHAMTSGCAMSEITYSQTLTCFKTSFFPLSLAGTGRYTNERMVV